MLWPLFHSYNSNSNRTQWYGRRGNERTPGGCRLCEVRAGYRPRGIFSGSIRSPTEKLQNAIYFMRWGVSQTISLIIDANSRQERNRNKKDRREREKGASVGGEGREGGKMKEEVACVVSK